MSSVEKEVDRILSLLRKKISERGFTQLEVQAKLDWGRSYLSQLFTKQKTLRVEQVLLILEAIDVPFNEFYAELYGFPLPGLKRRSGHPDPVPERPALGAAFHDVYVDYRSQRALVHGVVQVLVDKDLATLQEIIEAMKTVDPDPIVIPPN